MTKTVEIWTAPVLWQGFWCELFEGLWYWYFSPFIHNSSLVALLLLLMSIADIGWGVMDRPPESPTS